MIVALCTSEVTLWNKSIEYEIVWTILVNQLPCIAKRSVWKQRGDFNISPRHRFRQTDPVQSTKSLLCSIRKRTIISEHTMKFDPTNMVYTKCCCSKIVFWGDASTGTQKLSEDLTWVNSENYHTHNTRINARRKKEKWSRNNRKYRQWTHSLHFAGPWNVRLR